MGLVGFPAFPFPSPFGSNKQNNYIWFLREKIIYWWLRKFLNRAKDSSVGSQVVPLFKLISDLIMLILEVHFRQLDQNISKVWIFSNKQNILKNLRKSKFFLYSLIVNCRKFQNTKKNSVTCYLWWHRFHLRFLAKIENIIENILFVQYILKRVKDCSHKQTIGPFFEDSK